MRVATILAVALLGTMSLAGPGHAQAATQHYQLDIPRQSLDTALKDLAQQTGLQIGRFSERIDGSAVVGPVQGEKTPEQALKTLLSHTGLDYKIVSDTTIAVYNPKETSASPLVQRPQQDSKEVGKKSSQDFRVAQVDQGSAGPRAVGGGQNRDERGAGLLEEVVVTAQKREERLQDVPQSVTALSSDYLAKLGATHFSDFANTVPSLLFATNGAGEVEISMRGVTTGYDASPTVASYIDDVPYGSSTTFANAQIFGLDLGLSDVSRIEILRGPQGALYGASSMGGLIKYVTKVPDANNFGADVQTGVSSTGDGGGVGYKTSAAVNLPIVADLAAVRVSAFQYHDGGFIDNVARSIRDVNQGNVNGGRVDLLLTPEGTSGPLSIRATGFLQSIRNDGSATADYTFSGAMPYGSLSQYRPYPDGEPFYEHLRLGSFRVNYDFGFAQLTSISGYQTLTVGKTWDITENYIPFCALQGAACSSVGITGFPTLHKFTQEVRLASQGRNTVDWLLGTFYDHESSTYEEYFLLRNLANQPISNNLFTQHDPSTFREFAVYGDLTWHVFDRFEIDAGLRWARDDQSFYETGSGVIATNIPPTSSTESVRTYLADARYHFDDHAMVYVRYATGFRPGGPNFVSLNPATGLPNGPPESQPDQLKDYEVGLKAETANRRYSIDLDAYSIDWNNIQVQTSVGGLPVVENAQGGATVQGSELTLTARPITGLTTSAAMAYTHAYLREANPLLGASAGERLPGSPRFSGALDGDYQLPVGSLEPNVGVTVRYVGGRFVTFDANPAYPQYYLPAYATVDVRAGVTLRPSTSSPVDVQLYVHNLNDERGQLSILLPQFGAQVALLQPRTVGVNVSTRF
jgi:iron complex outermembrane recepter protein